MQVKKKTKRFNRSFREQSYAILRYNNWKSVTSLYDILITKFNNTSCSGLPLFEVTPVRDIHILPQNMFSTVRDSNMSKHNVRSEKQFSLYPNAYHLLSSLLSSVTQLNHPSFNRK